MEVPVYSLAERDRRWALARKLMAAEDVGALIAYGAHQRAVAAGFAPDAYFSNDLPGSVVIFCGDALLRGGRRGSSAGDGDSRRTRGKRSAAARGRNSRVPAARRPASATASGKKPR